MSENWSIDQACMNRGPRIDQDVAYCWLSKGHNTRRHSTTPEQGFDPLVTWPNDAYEEPIILDKALPTVGEYWWEKREIHAQRVAEGRCGNCGAFDGPTHRCPSVRG